MIEVLQQQAPDDFLKKCGAFLEASPAEHNLILSLCQMAQEKIKSGGQADIRFSSLFDDDGLIVASVQTPPKNLVLSRARDASIEKLAETLAGQEARFPGIVGPSDVAANFTNAWTALTGQQSVEHKDHIIYSLTKVLMPTPVEGELRPAKMEEKNKVAQWLAAFANDALPKSESLTEEEALKKADDFIKTGRIFVWAVNGKPVAQAAVAGTGSVARVSGVYTPPEERGHGYASAAVANLSKKQLDDGKTLCCLYADARNPVSNSIYRKIGYEFVGRSSLYVLGK